MLLGRLLNNLGALYLKLLVPISLFILGSFSLCGSCEYRIDTPNSVVNLLSLFLK